MTFPITKYPLCITHSDGSGLKTEKSKLLNNLEELQDGFRETPLPLIDVTLIDGGQLIHSFLSAIGKITSYRSLTMTLLAYVCGSEGKEIHVLFDTYHHMSLKETERKLRGGYSSLLVQSKHPYKAVRTCSKTGSSLISCRCLASKNDKNIIMVQSLQTRGSYCPIWWRLLATHIQRA